ncbi:hypothetical protein K737_300710 [Holospora undulata HU1]|uniref:Uncharacterized protein n=2 Tax=Holospora TaxID=44747 RepID=A0A061JHI0_9PROT|nr:hypothetical protein K737_300710 [Holospora undulata HU1]
MNEWGMIMSVRRLFFVFWLGASLTQTAEGMVNPFSFQVDGVDFGQATTPDEKADWAKLVDKGMDKMEAARYILDRKKLRKK